MKELEQYDRVKLVTKKYIEDGVDYGSIGYIIEVYGTDSKEYEIEFSNSKTGETIAQVVTKQEDIELALSNS